MAYIEAERFAALKARVKAECLRRCHTGSVAEYGGEKYEYTNSPTEDHTVDVEHYDDILGSFDGYFAQAKLAEAEKETIPKLKQQVSDLQSVNEGLSAQITQAQLALCDVYELVIGG